jgi:uncharacterized protein YuzE
MRQRYLEVTFRRGKALAAYLYLPRATGARVERTLEAGHGVRIDMDAQGTPVGLEITAPSAVTMKQLNEVLAKLGASPMDASEWAPLVA